MLVILLSPDAHLSFWIDFFGAHVSYFMNASVPNPPLVPLPSNVHTSL